MQDAYVIAPRRILKVPRIRPIIAIVGLALVPLLASCVPSGLPETVLAPQMRYLCRDGSVLFVERAPGGQFAEASAGGQRARLMRADSAAQEKYSSGGTTLYLDGNQALLTSDSFVVAGPCIASEPLPVVQPWRP
jgi:membrane-bound inhibitor of C-type lysozyme